MPRVSSKGKCQFCQAEFSKAGMSKHLVSCPARQLDATISTNQKSKPTSLFHLLVEGRGATMYWMHLEIPVEATLSNLDGFLRETWLECCGHLSAFNINGISYNSTIDREWGMEGKSMRGVKLGRVLTVGQSFEHEYDFGTTTELKLRVVDQREGLAVKGNPIQLLAQNEPPPIPCDTCGKLATQVCCQCIYEGEGWVCDECAEEHECGEDMLLPVVNSPRVGMCAYAG